MLIVNADDWGLRPDITDAILHVFGAGRVTSTSAMVHMTDSARAARLAREWRLSTGLHLNLTFGYTAIGVPRTVRERQQRLVSYFSGRAARLAYDPRMRGVIRDCVRDQLDAFHGEYGSAPTHIDGHHHIHTCPTVVFSVPSGAVTRARAARVGGSSDARLVSRAVAGVQQALVGRRFRTPAMMLPLGTVHPDLGGSLDALAPAAGTPVEVMTHAQWDAERAALLTPAWEEILATYRTGTYAEL